MAFVPGIILFSDTSSNNSGKWAKPGIPGILTAVPKGEFLQYGGQAVVEGVMMRSPRYFAVAVRAPNGQIVLHTEPLAKTWIGRQKWLKLPFLRGTLALLDALALGIRALRFSANIQLAPEYQPGKEAEGGAGDPNLTEKVARDNTESIHNMAIGASMFLGIALGLVLFVLFPNFIADNVGIQNQTTRNLVSGLFKVVVFIGYIWLIGLMPEIRTIFRYHGAEHKAINTLEKDRELTLENCKLNTRLHPRCGTSFAIVVLIISIVAFTFIPRDFGYAKPINLLMRFGLEVLLLPIVAGISYEVIRLAGKLRNSALMTALVYPGLLTQYLTTREPDERQIEVALTALKACVDAEENGLQPESERSEEPNRPNDEVSGGTG